MTLFCAINISKQLKLVWDFASDTIDTVAYDEVQVTNIEDLKRYSHIL